MNNAYTYEDFKGITVDQAKANVSFSYSLENAVSDVTGLSVRKNAVFRTDAGEDGNQKRLLGLIPENRPIVSYGEVTDWITNEINKTGINYKIIDSVIMNEKRGTMQQRYVLDAVINNPDGYILSPMLILKSSYVGVPISIEMGTYRFICTNGAVAGGTVFERETISARRLHDFGEITIGDVVRRGVDKIVALTDRYQELDNESWLPYFLGFLGSEKVDVEFKKLLIKQLEEERTVIRINEKKTLKNEDFIGAYTVGEDTISNKDGVPILNFDNHKSKSAWDLYNDTTYISSNKCSSFLIRDRMSHMISEAFVA